jgi:hypothetical protein
MHAGVNSGRAVGALQGYVLPCAAYPARVEQLYTLVGFLIKYPAKRFGKVAYLEWF